MVVYTWLLKLIQRCQTSCRADGVAVGGAADEGVDRFRSAPGIGAVQNVGPAGHRGQGVPSADGLAIDGDIGDHLIPFLGAPPGNPEACDHLVEDKTGTAFYRGLPEGL